MNLEARQAVGGGNASGGKKLARLTAIMFFHIPLKITTKPADVNPITSGKLDVGTSEKYGGSTKDASFFSNGILKAFEVPSTQTTKGSGTEVKVIANGHVHTADNCCRVKGVWTCFGGGGSYTGYAK
ncbi:hypothetical protein FRC06_009217, partial [Ceratobasidium sp. 370]